MSMVLCREAIGSSERDLKEFKSVTAHESAYYALFALNTLYLVRSWFNGLYSAVVDLECNTKFYVSSYFPPEQVVFLVNVAYVLPAQELPERVNYALASGGAAAVTAVAVALKAL